MPYGVFRGGKQVQEGLSVRSATHYAWREIGNRKADPASVTVVWRPNDDAPWQELTEATRNARTGDGAPWGVRG